MPCLKEKIKAWDNFRCKIFPHLLEFAVITEAFLVVSSGLGGVSSSNLVAPRACSSEHKRQSSIFVDMDTVRQRKCHSWYRSRFVLLVISAPKTQLWVYACIQNVMRVSWYYQGVRLCASTFRVASCCLRISAAIRSASRCSKSSCLLRSCTTGNQV